MVEVLVALYFRHMRNDPRHPRDPARDRFILSKGHGAPALYATLAEAGYLAHDELLTLRTVGSRLQGHPSALTLPGIDACTGSLGQGLSIGLGLAMALARQGALSRVYCMLGDGELQEGQNWEAAMAAAFYRVGRLIAVVDRNGLQGDGDTESVLALGALEEKWAAFGWHVIVVPGHEFDALDAALSAAAEDPRPSVVIAQTTKGRGVSYMEGVVHWHHHPVSDDELAIALDDILHVRAHA
jgi:transketolase